MKKLFLLLIVMGIAALPVFAQGHGHGQGSGHHGMWPDSLETVTLTGTAIVDSNFFMPMYYLDVDSDNVADYMLSFGPYWYQPSSGAQRPTDGEQITILGALQGFESNFSVIVVYEINGLEWREPIEGGMHGWDGDHFWGDTHGDTTITGALLVDSTYFYNHYFLDTNDDQYPDFKLNLGPPWYIDQNKDLLFGNAGNITVTGSLHDEMMMDIPSLMVFEINGTEWRNPTGPPPWSGNWMHRGSNDTSYVFSPTDSLDWMAHPPGSMMGMMMGGGFFPDSVYCQFEEIHPENLPGFPDSTIFAGYYMNMYDPSGQSMMGGGGMMGGTSGMRFNQPTTFHFHYEDEQLMQMNLSENQLHLKYWDDSSSQWREVNNYSLDRQNNEIVFQNEEMFSYYAIFGEVTVTDVSLDAPKAAPESFTLHQNYPNPFNPETTIKFDIPEQNFVQLSIYNLLGQKIKTLVSQNLVSGSHEIKWDGKDEFSNPVPSGIYFAQLQVNNLKQTIKLNLIK